MAHHERVEGSLLIRPNVVQLENAAVGADAEDQTLRSAGTAPISI